MANNDALVLALFAAFATFTAFGAAVAGFVAAGGAVQALASWWTQHGEDEDRGKGNAAIRLWRTVTLRWLSATMAIVLITVFILAVIVISGVGLVLCFIWLDAYSHGSAGGINDTYRWIIRLFWIEAFLLTFVTFVAVCAAAGSALAASKSPDKAQSSADLDSALRDAALSCLDGHG